MLRAFALALSALRSAYVHAGEVASSSRALRDGILMDHEMWRYHQRIGWSGTPGVPVCFYWLEPAIKLSLSESVSYTPQSGLLFLKRGAISARPPHHGVPIREGLT